MAISQEFPTGTTVVITAKASISAGDANFLEYVWRRDGTAIFDEVTGGTSTLVTSTAGVYDVVVSHPNAESVFSETFTLTYRDPIDMLRIMYNPEGTGMSGLDNLNSDGSWQTLVSLDWNIADTYYEFGPDQNNGFNSGKSGWWRIYALEKDVELDITLRGSSGGGSYTTPSESNPNPNDPGNRSGEGGVGIIRRTFEQGQLYTIRVGDRRTDGNSYAGDPQGDDVSWNAPNGGRLYGGGGVANGGGCTYLKRGGTLLAVSGGGGGTGSDTSSFGGDGGGPNVAGTDGAQGGGGAAVVSPGTQVYWSNYITDPNVYQIMSQCGTAQTWDFNNTALSCDVEVTGNDVQNNGAWGHGGAGGAGSGVRGGVSSNSMFTGGGGGSGWASSAVTVVSNQSGGNPTPKNGSVLIMKTGFLRYYAQVIHTTGVRAGRTPSLNVIQGGSQNAEVIPQNVGYNTGDYDGQKHYLVNFPVAFSNTNYVLNITDISRLQASQNVEWTIIVSKVEKYTDHFRVWFTASENGMQSYRHVYNWTFDAY